MEILELENIITEIEKLTDELKGGTEMTEERGKVKTESMGIIETGEKKDWEK